VRGRHLPPRSLLPARALTVSPLRERRHQIAALAAKFAQHTLTPAALARLAAHDWPGNVRELKNVVERAALLAGSDPIGAEHLLFDQAPAAAPPLAVPDADGTERAKILAALEECAGNQTHAAKKLGISRATLVHKLDLYGVPRPRKR
jgi:transcriptional regulator of acetoin/glycerol metabolism